MGILELPHTTIRALGANQVLTDPASLIKELIDNALDARSTSIAIEISANTLDSIQVRDNGHGIAPDDRHLVARRHCTSKITNETDIQIIGGTSLGFRGEALASVAELSGSLVICTRVEGEPVATALKVSTQGELIGQERASLPVGTTVKIVDFIKANPVRRQIALKNTENCLKKTKHILQAYALARPHVRLSLRVLRAKNDNLNWTYAPSLTGNVDHAAYKVVGAACASQCTWAVLEENACTIKAFLPRQDADAIKISNVGAFVSIDDRPVSVNRGTSKSIVKIFKEALRSANNQLSGAKDPFLYLDIKCQTGTYDANVEPAKDDVLFEDAEAVIDLARKVFAVTYQASGHQQKDCIPTHPDVDPAQSSAVEGLYGSPMLALQRPAVATPERQQRHLDPHRSAANEANSVWTILDTAENQNGIPPSPQRLSAFRSNMYGCDEEYLYSLDDTPSTGQTDAEFEELRQARNNVNISNPWVTAKLNSSLRHRELSANGSTLPPNREGVPPASPDTRWSSVDPGKSQLPSPRPSSPQLRIEEFHPSRHVPDLRFGRDGRVVAAPRPQGSLPFMPATPRASATTQQAASSPREGRGRPEYIYDMALAAERNINDTEPHHSPELPRQRPEPHHKALQTRTHKPFVPPVRNHGHPDNVHSDRLNGMARPRARANRIYRTLDHNTLVSQSESADTIDHTHTLLTPRQDRDIRDFVGYRNTDPMGSFVEPGNLSQTPEHAPNCHVRNTPDQTQAVHHDDRNAGPPRESGFIPASRFIDLEETLEPVEGTDPKPRKRRRTGERHALQEMEVNTSNRLEDTNDRQSPSPQKEALSRRKGSNKLSRRKSSRLPLERTPPGQDVHSIVLKVSPSCKQVASSADKLDMGASLLTYAQPAMLEVYAPLKKNAALVTLDLAHALSRLLVGVGPATVTLDVETISRALEHAFVSGVEDPFAHVELQDGDVT